MISYWFQFYFSDMQFKFTDGIEERFQQHNIAHIINNNNNNNNNKQQQLVYLLYPEFFWLYISLEMKLDNLRVPTSSKNN